MIPKDWFWICQDFLRANHGPDISPIGLPPRLFFLFLFFSLPVLSFFFLFTCWPTIGEKLYMSHVLDKLTTFLRVIFNKELTVLLMELSFLYVSLMFHWSFLDDIPYAMCHYSCLRLWWYYSSQPTVCLTVRFPFSFSLYSFIIYVFFKIKIIQM